MALLWHQIKWCTPSAFSNLTADVQYTYSKAGLSQDIVLRQSPPAPDSYGLSDQTTILQVYTEFFNPPQPEMTAVRTAMSLTTRFWILAT